MRDGILATVVFLVTIPFTALFLAWFTILPSIGAAYMLGWLK